MTASSRQWLARPEIDRAPYLHLRDHLAKRGDAAQALPAQRLFKCRESAHESQLSRQASAAALKLLQAPPSMLGQYGSSSAKRCEHVEVTFSD